MNFKQQRLYRMAFEFLQTCTFHGAGRTVISPGLCMRVFWTVLFSTSLAVSMSEFYKLSVRFMNKSTDFKKTVSVTLCERV